MILRKYCSSTKRYRNKNESNMIENSGPPIGTSTCYMFQWRRFNIFKFVVYLASTPHIDVVGYQPLGWPCSLHLKSPWILWQHNAPKFHILSHNYVKSQPITTRIETSLPWGIHVSHVLITLLLILEAISGRRLVWSWSLLVDYNEVSHNGYQYLKVIRGVLLIFLRSLIWMFSLPSEWTNNLNFYLLI